MDTDVDQYCRVLLERYDDIVPEHHREKWCILFGSRVLETASSYEEAVAKHDEMMSHGVKTVILPPFGRVPAEQKSSATE